MTSIVFDYPLAWTIGLPLAAAVLAVSAYRNWRSGCAPSQVATLTTLRAVALLVVLMLAARPVWVDPNEELAKRDEIVLLIDRSESMSLANQSRSRYHSAVEFARMSLVPALHAANLRVDLQLFAEDSESADGPRVASAVPDGKRTNLGRAIARSVIETEKPPLAVIALTDGATTDDADNSRAVATLVENRVPFIGIGFGDEIATQVLSLEHVVAPSVVSPDQEFAVSARLRATGAEELPPLNLVLLRDGQFVEQRVTAEGTAPRVWQESFQITEPGEGLHRYTIQLLPPADPLIKCPNTAATATVRIATEKELRILFVQGGLTWDYKFIRLAVAQDPSIKLTGLSRTTSQSAFFQYVENADDLAGGFPTKMDDLARFRVVVLSNLRTRDLTPTQQELLAKFCYELGGGVLMIGGQNTFDSSWKQSRLEQLLPVHFATRPGSPSSPPFRFQLTEYALAHPVFQISDSGNNQAAWSKLPPFNHYALVSSVKPGARVWAHGVSHWRERPVLMASQRYGAGMSAVICAQNLWRWRLARDCETHHFDRFWRQLIRYLGEGSQGNLVLRVPDQPLEPGRDIRLVIEMRQVSGDAQTTGGRYLLHITDEDKQLLHKQSVELVPGQFVDVSFTPEESGVFTASLLDDLENPVATRSLEVKVIDREFVYTARDMETLGGWAAVSDGIAIRCEECADPEELLDKVSTHATQPRRGPHVRRPAGINGWMLTVLLGCLGSEWLLRKRWGMS